MRATIRPWAGRASFSRDAERSAPGRPRTATPSGLCAENRVIALLGESDRLRSMAELVGSTALPDRERIVLLTADLIREAVLQQSALSPNDVYCSPSKQAALMDAVLQVHDHCLELIQAKVPASMIEEVDISALARAKDAGGPDDIAAATSARDGILAQLEALR